MNRETEFAKLRADFRQLHESGCFVIPNPWDAGTACYLRYLGFKAVATTSAGFAFSKGLPDASWAVPIDMALSHIEEICKFAGVPVNADFESGYAHDPEGVAANVKLCIATGVAGLSIEDRSDDPEQPLYDLPVAVERIQAARRAIDESGSGVLLTARTECFLVGRPEPFDEAIRRLQAFADAGADVLFAPGPTRVDHIRGIVQAVSPKPVNVLMSGHTGLRAADLGDLGVRRISVGSSLARASWGAFVRASKAIADQGSFAGFDDAVPFKDLNEFFRKELADRAS